MLLPDEEFATAEDDGGSFQPDEDPGALGPQISNARTDAPPAVASSPQSEHAELQQPPIRKATLEAFRTRVLLG